MEKRRRSFALLFSLSAGLSQGEFTYLDANLTNTTLAGTPFTLEPPANFLDNVADGDDGLWSYRELSSFEGGAYFESDNGTPSEDEQKTSW